MEDGSYGMLPTLPCEYLILLVLKSVQLSHLLKLSSSFAFWALRKKGSCISKVPPFLFFCQRLTPTPTILVLGHSEGEYKSSRTVLPQCFKEKSEILCHYGSSKLHSCGGASRSATINFYFFSFLKKIWQIKLEKQGILKCKLDENKLQWTWKKKIGVSFYSAMQN